MMNYSSHPVTARKAGPAAKPAQYIHSERQEQKMTKEQETMLNRINRYAEQEMADIDPQKTPISVQLEKLRPIMETIASEQGRPLEEIFIEYMDLASEFSVEKARQFKEDYLDFDMVQDDIYKSH